MNDSYKPEPDPEEDWLVDVQNSSLSGDESVSSNQSDSSYDIFEDLRHLRNKNRKQPIISYININSIRYKFDDLQQILHDKLTDILVVAETKLDESFSNNLFSTDGYKMERRDRDRHGGGLMAFLRSDLPVKRRTDLESKDIESICIELSMNKRKWGILCLYRKPTLQDCVFEQQFTNCLDKMYISFDHIICIGDLNYDLLKADKCRPLTNVCDNFNLENIVKNLTCCMKNNAPTLIDVILTNSKNLLCNTINFNCGLSDCHNMICTNLKEQCDPVKKKKVNFRSYKNFDEGQFNSDLSMVPFHVAYVFDDIDDIYWAHELLLRQVVDEHAPIKQKCPKKKSPPYMNSNYRKIIYKTRQAKNAYSRNKTSENWQNYVKFRNQKTKVKHESISVYFQESCGGGPKSKDFWPTIKPFLSQKSTKKSDEPIILKDTEENLISEQGKVVEKLNTFYINIAQNIGINANKQNDETHPSVQKIKSIHGQINEFQFKPVTEGEIKKCIKKLDPKKSTGVDLIPPKLILAGCESLSVPIRDMTNTIISRGSFPENLKLAQVTPIFKKDDPFTEKNYRPVSILPTLSKIYERVISDQLSSHFENIFHSFLAAFRPSFGCQTTLLRLVEDWKRALDENLDVGAILMDLSKAFDCLPHDLIIEKLKAYGLTEQSCQLMHSYLSGRKQRVKLGNCISNWQNIIKGVPQGSILGPLIFNISMNDIFYFLEKSTLYNYADDNTVSYCHKIYEIVLSVLQK